MTDKEHISGNLYLEMSPYEYCMKCHLCVGEKFPCEHIKLSKDDLKQIFNMVKIENLQINNVNNYYGENKDDTDLDEFKKINLFEDEYLNTLVYNGLNGKSTPLAEIMGI